VLPLTMHHMVRGRYLPIVTAKLCFLNQRKEIRRPVCESFT